MSLESARRLAVTKQHLADKLTIGSTQDAILSVIRDLGYVQLDPVNVVAPSHLITLWSRVGNFRTSDLDRLLWDDKKLFEHWSHAASIVLTEDYPLFYSLMRRYRSEEHTSELQSRGHLVCRLLLEKKKT